jgi:hypothetical protein
MMVGTPKSLTWSIVFFSKSSSKSLSGFRWAIVEQKEQEYGQQFVVDIETIPEGISVKSRLFR